MQQHGILAIAEKYEYHNLREIVEEKTDLTWVKEQLEKEIENEESV